MGRPTIAQLEAFVWTARYRSVRKAAEELNLAQPTISLRLRDLRHSLKATLFERAGQSMVLTQAGRDLLPLVEAALERVDDIISLGGEPEIRGTIRLGLAEGMATVCLPRLIEVLHDELPRLQPEWVISPSDGLEGELAARRLDAALVVNPVGQSGLRFMPISVQRTLWAVAPSWGLSGPVTPEDLSQKPILTNGPSSAMHRQIMGWFATAGLAPARLDICSSVTVIAQLVAAGTAISVFPVKLIESYVRAKTMQILSSTPAVESGSVFFAFSVGHETAATNEILRIVRRVLKDIRYFE
ncbi:LysR family transcriptional regulator [Acidocella sp.]|jgi:DNA-binding transcriptional LysR family regulator|uniref:LysR family transcriptional regulator n=1 Tax=Acidocella sp. TaxID=50710 RepID=UPI002F421CF1